MPYDLDRDFLDPLRKAKEEKHKIRVGDYVRVFFQGDITSSSIEGVVEYVPCQPGDDWIIVEDDGDVNYVRNYEFIRRRLTDNERVKEGKKQDKNESPEEKPKGPDIKYVIGRDKE